MDKQKLRKRVLADWIAIDKLLFENRKPNRFSPSYSKYIAAKAQLIKESYRLKRLLGQTDQAILETFDEPKQEASNMISTCEEIIVELGRKNRALAEALILSDKGDIRKARLEALMLGETLLDESVIKKASHSVGYQIKRQVFESLVDAVVELSKQC